jgi:hypothetical protein
VAEQRSEPQWTLERVHALAPDAVVAQAARGLARPGQWSGVGAAGTLLWGRCQGRGHEPYLVTVDLAGPHLRCTCPSRKQPCKHALALLFLWVRGGGSVGSIGAADEVPDFASDWAGRAARARREAGDAARAAKRTPDREAQAKRQAEREALMSAGIDDFERWLFDLVRQGFAAARRQPYRFWDAAAARLVDAQLPALAERVRVTGGVIHERADWVAHLLGETGRWYLAVRAWRDRERLPGEVVADLRVFLGWHRRTDEVLAGERLHDRWTVCGLHHVIDDPRVTTRRTWLHGEGTHETVVILDFAATGMTLSVSQMLGSVIDATVACYPGSPPRRVLFTGDEHAVGGANTIVGATGIAAALERSADLMAANPWTGRAPMALSAVTPVADAAGAVVVADATGAALPVDPLADRWLLLALSAGRPVDVFGEWDDGRLLALAVGVDGTVASL